MPAWPSPKLCPGTYSGIWEQPAHYTHIPFSWKKKIFFFINVYYNFVRNTCQQLASSVKERSDRKKESDKEIALSGTENVHRTNYLGEFMKEDNKYLYVF